MQKYKSRKIEFREIIEIEDWTIKIYTISQTGKFSHPKFYENVKLELPKWLSMENSFNSSTDKFAFLILHSGTEGVYSLINWWVGDNMLNTHIFLTTSEEPAKFNKISGDGLAPCIWEMEVVYHESIARTQNILKQYENPNYKAYLEDVYNGDF